MTPWPRAPVIPQLVDRKTFRDNRWVRHLSLTSCTGSPRVTTPNEDRYLAITAKETDGAQHQICLVSSLQLPVRQFQGRSCKYT
ncbi:uncharacterized protein TNCV_4681991 [Trichonephila clavipes]|nr:uncharacterized protein TNCV_4681991 [Trichonephila clavipes]